MTLVLDFSAKIYSLDGIYNVSIANNKTLANFAALLCMRREDMTEARPPFEAKRVDGLTLLDLCIKNDFFLMNEKT